jgi:hypothetical protein
VIEMCQLISRPGRAGRCALSGYSAAELLGARCAPTEANAELTVPGGDFRELGEFVARLDMAYP